MDIKAFLVCTGLITYVIIVDCLEEDIFRSSEHLQHALWKGNQLLNKIDLKQIAKNSTRTKVNRYKFDFGLYTSLKHKWTDGIARHPIYIYNMVRDLYFLRKLKNSLRNENAINMTDLPTKEDFIGTVSALIRLQDTYRLNTTDMAAGIIADEPSMELSVGDCFIIGQVAHRQKNYDQAIKWLAHALSMTLSGKKKLRGHILSIKCDSEYQLGIKNEALQSVDQWLLIDSSNKEAKNMRQNILKMPNKKKEQPFQQSPDYSRLCRGEQTKKSNNITVTSMMYCRFFDNNRNPLLILQPARQEDMNVDPHIKVYRDVISESEMRLLKSLVKAKLQISMVKRQMPDKKDFQPAKSDSRVSKGHSLFETPKNMPIIRKLQRRIQAITGLRSRSYEAMQVVNYGIGGFYSIHNDWSPHHKIPEHNERIATFMFYLSEVEAGGATVFPAAGIRMAPSKGDALFWYNLHRNNIGHIKTMHTACPVLLGTKWVATQWIGRHHQEFVRPCTLDEYE